MGIEVQSVRLLLLAGQKLGVDFADTLTIGRQEIMASAAQMEHAFRTIGLPISKDLAQSISAEKGKISDPLFRQLGARNIDAMDVSDFEGASVLHDLNRPISDSLAERFSLVFDGGTLEHVFNVTTALESYMKMPRVGGHLILALPANNEMGHGFYQFSPEFFFRTLTSDNGYAIEAMFLAPLFQNANWLAVKDPAIVGTRVGLNTGNDYQYLFVVARRLASLSIFQKTPQQSDYLAEWGRVASGGHRWLRAGAKSSRQRLKDIIRPIVPEALVGWLRQRAIGRRPSEMANFVAFDPASPHMDLLKSLYLRA